MEGGAARLEPGLPEQVCGRELVLRGFNTLRVRPRRLHYHLQHEAEVGLCIRGERVRFRRVLGQVIEQWRVMMGHVGLSAEACVRVETGGRVFRVEIRSEEKGFPY